MAITPSPISDSLWSRIETIIGQNEKEPETKLGRKPISKRLLAEAFIHKLRYGFTWSLIQNGHTAFRWTKSLSKEQLMALREAVIEASDELELTEGHIKTIEAYFGQYFLDEPIVQQQKKVKKRISSKERAEKPKKSSYRDKSRQIETIWTVEPDLAARIEPIINELCPFSKMGRPRIEWIQVFNAIIWKVRTGTQWRGVPRAMGSRTTIRRWRQRWEETGVLRRIHEIVIEEADKLNLIDWETNIVDGTLIKARRGGECCGSSAILPRKNTFCINF